jgi:molybdopterin molybdotransferase
MQERAVRRGDILELAEPVSLGRNIRRRGEDVVRGAAILPAGTVLRAHELGLLAALGEASVRVWPRPRVSVVVSGDELVPPGRRLGAGRIYESNGTLLAGLVPEAGAILADRSVVADRLPALAAAIARGLASDVLVLCGGVSVGDRDFVKAAAAQCGVRKVFWRVSIKPGMPLYFGVHGRTLVFGLPGNPVSVFVTWNELVRPALDRLLGRPGGDRYTTPAVLGAALSVSRGRRTHFVRVQCQERAGRLVATPAAAQGSHHLLGLAGAGGWLRVDSRKGPLAAGTPVEVRREAVPA